ncbi:MAG: PIG-L deacetylase family protein [Candidatus Woesearchaeota archaeon]
MASDTIMVIVAHADDQVLGFGGSLAKYIVEGKTVVTVVFSYSERSAPHYKNDIIRERTIEESRAADKVLGGSGVTFLGLRSGHLEEDFRKNGAQSALRDLLLKHMPSKIFTHAIDDSLSDHKAVNRLLLGVYDNLKNERRLSSDVYGFGIWRLFRFKRRHSPRLVVDVSDTFSKKLRAIDVFKSQRPRLFILKIGVYVNALLRGLKHGAVFVEEFQKLR